jgi:DUF2075 family protein
VVVDRSGPTLHALIRKNVHPDATLVTDELGGYKGTNYAHEIINHAEEYVRGHIHTNGIENFWCLLKRGLKGTYVNVASAVTQKRPYVITSKPAIENDLRH